MNLRWLTSSYILSMSSRNSSSGSSSDIDSADESAVDSFHHPESELAADAPRIVQWEAEEEHQQAYDSENPPSDETDVEQSNKNKRRNTGKQLNSDSISGIPFGTLLKARQRLEHDHEDSSSSAGESSGASQSDLDDGRDHVDSGKQKNVEWEPKRSHALDKRSNKHAPVEMSSKRPVTRRRVVVESKEVRPRDPRFLPLTGELSTSVFQSHS
ncbi:hypothetical protein BD410DRAFT_235440 [Rickenella mellea]|uniref:rRNA biogenesis protein RRP36 n=1 Tax=Rickenella mellea TaxID=50990 RepID=A0A4Y7QN13_9AGAM|nr:hypothetical protein BD410DRAFT_235440 [Rickenella mellea]